MKTQAKQRLVWPREAEESFGKIIFEQDSEGKIDMTAVQHLIMLYLTLWKKLRS